MKHENENSPNLHTGLKRREFMAMLAGCTAGLMVPGFFHFQETIAAASAAPSDRLGKLLPLRRLGSSGPVVTNLGVGGDHVGSASEKEAQAIIEKALEEGVRFFDNAPLYSNGKAEE
ncbi:MAG: aldo/keto reductase, partial [Desulfobacteraceae bacterium]